MYKKLPDYDCKANGFQVNLYEDDFLDEGESDECLPSYLRESWHIIVDIINDGSNPFFPDRYNWCFAIINVDPEHADKVIMQDGIVFVPVVGAISDIRRILIQEEGAEVGMFIYLKEDPDDNAHVMVLLTETATA